MKGRAGTFLTLAHTQTRHYWEHLPGHSSSCQAPSLTMLDGILTTTVMMAAVCRNVGSLLPCSSPRVMWDLFTSSLPPSPFSPVSQNSHLRPHSAALGPFVILNVQIPYLAELRGFDILLCTDVCPRFPIYVHTIDFLPATLRSPTF